jgi:hypothetical protein
MSSQINSAIAANAEARETLPSPVSPLTPSFPSHEAQQSYSSIAPDGPDSREHVNAAQVLPDSSARTNTAHGPAHLGLGFGESRPEGGRVDDETTRTQPLQNVPGLDKTIVEAQSVGETPILIDLIHCSLN